VGAWRLVSVEANAGGKIGHPLGGSPKGFLVLTPDGYWSAQLMAEGHGIGGRDPSETYRAHFGTYEVDEGAKKLVLHRDGDLDASGVGADTYRFFELDGSRVVMTIPAERRGNVDVTTRVVWERVGEGEKRDEMIPVPPCRAASVSSCSSSGKALVTNLGLVSALAVSAFGPCCHHDISNAVISTEPRLVLRRLLLWAGEGTSMPQAS
jgi:hypothetical protein